MVLTSTETIFLSVASSSVLATLISIVAGYLLERKRWLRDKRLEEWRELVIAVESAIYQSDAVEKPRSGLDSPEDARFDPFRKKRREIENLYSLLRTRIFTRGAVEREQLVERWLALRVSFSDPDGAIVSRKHAGEFQEALERAIEQDVKLFHF